MKRLASALLVLLALAGALAPVAVAVIVTPDVIMVDPNADIQAAIDELSSTAGGEIHLGSGTYTLTAPLIIDRPVKLFGAGMYSTYIYCASPDSDIVRVTGSGVSIRDLSIKGPESAGTGIGLSLKPAVDGFARNFAADNVYISNTGSWCAAVFGGGWMDTTLSGGLGGTVIAPSFSRCVFSNNQSGGTLYVGHGVAAPNFTNCNFTGSSFTRKMRGWTAAMTTKYDSLQAWNWYGTIPAFHVSTDSTILHRGHVYLCVATDAKFSGCVFQQPSTGDSDEPVLSIEDCHSTLFRDCYFEAFGTANGREHPFVTISASGGWLFDGCYAYSSYGAPFHFLRTNSHASSPCSGTISNFYGRQGGSTVSISAEARLNDFVFNTTLDGKESNPIILSNIRIATEDVSGVYWRNADVRQFNGNTGFYTQNVLLQNSARRFRVPNVSSDTLATTYYAKPGEMAFVHGGAINSGQRGRLFIAADNTTWAPMLYCPSMADAAARDVFYSSPGAYDMAFVRSDSTFHFWNGARWMKVSVEAAD